MLDGIVKDLRSGLRSLRKHPLLAFYVVTTLALGIGANTAAFSLFRAVLIRPLPYEQPRELVKIGSLQALPDILDWREQSRSFAEIGAFQPRYYDYLARDGRPQRLSAAVVSASLLDLLAAEPVQGRRFTPAEDTAGGERVVVLSERAWRRWLSSDPAVIGQSITLSGNPYTILGVLPDSLLAPSYEAVDLWLPVAVETAWATFDRGAAVMHAYGRLKEGVGIEQAQADLETIAARLEQEHPQTNKDRDVTPTRLDEALFGDSRPLLRVLMAAVALVLLIACANIANLLLARAMERRQEIAVRSALGAGRGALMREMLAQSLVLAALGGLLGGVLAFWLLRGFQAVAPAALQRIEEASLDGTALAFTAAVALLTGLLFGLAPSVFAARTRVTSELASGAQQPRGSRTRYALVMAEVILTTVLLVGSGLLIRSFHHLMSVDLGYDTDNVLTVDLTLPEARYASIESQTAFFREVFRRVGALPGVEAAGAVSQIPLGARAVDHGFYIEGRVPASPGQEPRASTRLVSPGYFDTLGVRLAGGRRFTDRDDERAPRVAIVNRSMAREHWPNEDPVGQRLRWIYGPEAQPWMTVVGVVEDVKQFGLDAQDGPAVYTPYSQKLRDWKRWMTLAVRSGLPPETLTQTVKEQIWAVDGELPVVEVSSLAEEVTSSAATERFLLVLLTSFAVLALLLTAGGIYAVLSYLVLQRRREVGLRIALGARPSEVRKMFVRQGMAVVGIALALGAGLAWLLTRWMSALLFEVEAADLPTFALAVVLLGAVAALACDLPAARLASRPDPVALLRTQ